MGIDPRDRMDIMTHKHSHSPDSAAQRSGEPQTQAGHAQTRTYRPRGARTRRGTAARRHASPEGTRTRLLAPRYLHVVDDGLEEPAQGAALLLRRLAGIVSIVIVYWHS